MDNVQKKIKSLVEKEQVEGSNPGCALFLYFIFPLLSQFLLFSLLFSMVVFWVVVCVVSRVGVVVSCCALPFFGGGERGFHYLSNSILSITMSHPGDRAYLPPGDNEDNQREGRSRRSHSGGSPTKEDKKKRKLAQHRHRRHHNHHPQHHEEEHQGEGMNAQDLIERFRQILEDGDERPGTDIQKARNALEATAGNMEMAAQLYWDDYVASQAVANPPQPPPQREESKADRKVAAKDSKSPTNDDDGSSSSDDDYDPPSPGLRRSLDGDFGRAAGEDRPQHAGNNNNDQGGDEHGNHENSRRQRQHRIHRHFAADRQAPMQMDMNFEDGDEQIQRGIEQQQLQQQRQAAREAIRGQQARLEMGESVSVSDDETGCAGVWKMVGTMVARRNRLPQNELGQRVREAAAAVADKVLAHSEPTDKQRKRRKVLAELEEDETDYISDSDWLEEDASQIKDPFELLWGGTSRPVSSGGSISENPEGNVVADEDAEDQSVLGVPHTWLVSV